MRRLALALALLLGTGCDSTTPSDNPVGTFDLVAVNGESLPTTAGKVMVLGGGMVVRADGTYTQAWDFAGYPRGDHSGTFRMDGEWIRFLPYASPSGVGTGEFTGRRRGEALVIVAPRLEYRAADR